MLVQVKVALSGSTVAPWDNAKNRTTASAIKTALASISLTFHQSLLSASQVRQYNYGRRL